MYWCPPPRGKCAPLTTHPFHPQPLLKPGPGDNKPGKVIDTCVPTLGASIAEVCASPRPDIEVLIAEGVGFVGNDTSGVGAALAAVAQADVVVIAVGYTNRDVEREGADHNYTVLPPVQAQFAGQVLAAAKARGVPVVMVLINAGQIAVDTLLPAPDALVEAFYPAFGAPALARQLFGLENHWGRLPYTIYESSFAGRISLFDMNVSGDPGRTWRYYKGAPNYKFGDGLGYAVFSLACSGPPPSLPAGPALALSIACNSTFAGSPAGLTSGDEVLLVLHRPGPDVVASVGGRHPVPFGSLRGFERVALTAGGGAVGTAFPLAAADFALIDNSGAAVLYPGTHFFDVSPRAPGAPITLQVTLTGSAPVVLSQPPPLPPPRAA